ncbi:MAG: DUF308 domain-containing protein [Anaerolineales bacterium]|nr:DUF308 domain-containing protein [Anaerolineales bacterium]
MTTQTMTKNDIPWWIPLIQGIASIILGFMLVTSTGRTVFFLVTFIGIYWLVDGVFSIIAIFLDRTAWGWKLFRGVLGILAGMVVLGQPLASAIILPWFMVTLLAFQSIIIGGIAIFQAFRGAGWGNAALGVMGILIGLLLLGNTLVAAWIMAWMLGAFMIVGGIAAVFLAFRLKP